ncbi:hypothetical protein LLH23_03085 [bacterium]|nr:hypothetical protein [bacterium]
MRLPLLPLLVVMLPAAFGHAQVATMDRNGRVTALTVAGEELPVVLNFRLPLRGWGRQPSLTDARDVQTSTVEGKRVCSGRIEVESGKFYRYEETVSEQGGQVVVEMRVTAEAAVDLDGVYLWLDLPQDRFRGGEAALTAGGTAVAAATMPVDPPAARHFLRGQADALTCGMPVGDGSLAVALDRVLPVTVQDNREWKTETYSAFCQLAAGLKPGESTAVRVALTSTLKPDTTPAKLSVDPGHPRYRLDGFGGNYCFAIESPVTQYTLSHLKQAWARTELTATEWEPQNDNEDPGAPDWAAFESRDKAGSNLRREFELAKQIQGLGRPYVISIWDLPGWLYEDGGAAPRDSRHRIHPDKWPELLELLGTYLQYARRQYGVEPDLFCFNEANIGVRVFFSPEEHRDAIKRIGAYFKAQGLKTRMLLADATGPRGTHTYALPAAADPEAMQYVGAVAFHSWGGGSAADYAAWGDLAERLKLPLLVTELGVDAGAWRTRAYDNTSYALREVRMYQELLLHARPQGTMQWEFTADYSIVKLSKEEQGQERITPTVRFFFVKHFCNLTPYHSQALTTVSDHPKVLVTAFSAGAALTVHIANLGAARSARLSGLPADLTRLQAVRTSAEDSFRQLEPVPVVQGAVAVELPAQSLLTLTTLTPE